jgi:hypothetical protein
MGGWRARVFAGQGFGIYQRWIKLQSLEIGLQVLLLLVISCQLCLRQI